MPSGPSSWREHARVLGPALAAALAARIAFCVLVPPEAHSTDVENWTQVARLLAAGANPYAATRFLNWPPFWMQWIFLLQRVQLFSGIPFFRLLQGLLIGVDCAGLVLLYSLARKLSAPLSLRYLVVGLSLNPISILEVCQHGNFDVLVAFWVLLFLLALCGASDSGLDWLSACLFLGLGILTKTVPLVLTPLVLPFARPMPWRHRLVAALLVLGPVTLGMSVVYSLSPSGVTESVLNYRSMPGYYGISGLLLRAGATGVLELYLRASPWLFGAALLALSVVALRRPALPPEGAVLFAGLILLATPTLGPGYSPQNICWFLPLYVLLDHCNQGPLRTSIRLLYAIAAVTYVIEYALLPSHGMLLAHLFPQGAFARWGRALFAPGNQTLLRLPLFAVELAVLAVGARKLALLWRFRGHAGG